MFLGLFPPQRHAAARIPQTANDRPKDPAQDFTGFPRRFPSPSRPWCLASGQHGPPRPAFRLPPCPAPPPRPSSACPAICSGPPLALHSCGRIWNGSTADMAGGRAPCGHRHIGGVRNFIVASIFTVFSLDQDRRSHWWDIGGKSRTRELAESLGAKATETNPASWFPARFQAQSN